MASGYAIPVMAWLTRTDGERIVKLPDGTEMTVADWRKVRVSPDEFYRLATLKHDKVVASWDPVTQVLREPVPEDPDDV